jgi:DNA-binding MarR family transcriptional regulator
MADAVDRVLEQWRRERPDLDFAAMGTVGRLLRLVALATPELEATMARHGLSGGEADVLFTLRRAGFPHTLRPGDLAKAAMLSPAGITARVDKLEAGGLVTRELDPDDRRSFKVTLTPRGRRLADRMLSEHLAREERLLEPLTQRERATLDRLTSKLLGGLD